MRRLLVVFAVLLVVGAVGAAGLWSVLEARLDSFGREAFGGAEVKLVSIPPGSNPRKVATLLARAAVVSDPDRYYGWLRKQQLGNKLKAGEYEFQGPLTPAEVTERLIKGEVKHYHFTIAEGLRVDEILPLLAASELELDRARLVALVKDPAEARKLGVPADSFEGFLFPDTYSFPRGATEEAVLRKMVERTLEEVRRAPRREGVALDTLAAVTLASIVEKETGAPAERPHIACVFHNRLRQGMKLMTDPTVLYAKWLRTGGAYSKNITRADLRAEHPYNTYTARGLPPGPIASPGVAALRAALDPPDCDDLFFVSRNDGTSVFCPDLKCHNAAVQKWQIDFHRKKD